MKITNRIPVEYVIAAGAGQTTFGPGADPFETGAYDQALLDAGIENFNIMKYTSVMPPEATEITMEDAVEAGYTHHGMALECIMARQDGVQGEHVCAGVGRAKVLNEHGELIGGFATEYEGPGSTRYAEKELKLALEGIFERRGYDKKGYVMCDMEFVTKDLVIDESFGTVLVGICFMTFDVMELS